MMLEISVTLADGEMRYFEVNLQKTFEDICNRPTANGTRTLADCEVAQSSIDDAQKLLDSYNVTGLSAQDYLSPARVSKRAATSSPPTVETPSNDALALHFGLMVVLMTAAASLAMVMF